MTHLRGVTRVIQRTAELRAQHRRGRGRDPDCRGTRRPPTSRCVRRQAVEMRRSAVIDTTLTAKPPLHAQRMSTRNAASMGTRPALAGPHCLDERADGEIPTVQVDSRASRRFKFMQYYTTLQ